MNPPPLLRCGSFGNDRFWIFVKKKIEISVFGLKIRICILVKQLTLDFSVTMKFFSSLALENFGTCLS